MAFKRTGLSKGLLMKTIFALLVLSVSTAASSACYQIYAPSNELVWQGTTAPVPMDNILLAEEVQKIVPKGHMVISNATPQQCPAFDITAPDRTMRKKAEDMKYD
jgi:hypothetical protein